MPPGTRSAPAGTAPSAPRTTPARCARSAAPGELGGLGEGVSGCCGEPQPLSLLPLPFSRCPSGQVKIAPCTPHSDLQCGPPTGSISGSSSKFGMAGGMGGDAGGVGAAASTCPVSPAITIIIILIVVALVVGLLLVLVWKRCCRHPAAGEGGGTRDAAPKWGLWVGRGTSLGADGSVFPSRGQQRPGQKVRPSGGESCWGLCLVPASLAAPPGRLGERAGGCGRAKRGSPAAPPSPGGWYHHPGWESPAWQLCVSLPPSTTWCCS